MDIDSESHDSPLKINFYRDERYDENVEGSVHISEQNDNVEGSVHISERNDNEMSIQFTNYCTRTI